MSAREHAEAGTVPFRGDTFGRLLVTENFEDSV
jgi:hypothetical protein